MKRSLFIALVTAAAWICLPSLAFAADVSVSASLEPSVVNIGGTTTLEVTARVNANRPIRVQGKPSARSAFRVVGTRRSPQLVIRNGKVRRTLTLTYRLRAVRTGEFDIAPPRLRIGRKTVKAEPQSVKVVKSGVQPDSPDRGSSARAANGDVIVAASVEPSREPYLGQQITVTYSLYVDPHRGSVKPRPPDEPSLDRFWIEDLSEDVAGRSKMTRFDGRLMKKTVLRSYALFPLETGTLTIDPMHVDVRTGGFFSQGRKFELQSEPIDIDVRSLPEDAPDSFYEGNVGRWSFRIETDTTLGKVGEPLTVTMIASGTGNLRRLQLPKLEGRLDGFRVQGREEDVEKDDRGTKLAGQKRVTYTLMPTKEGNLELPALAFSFFNPDERSYETIESEPRQFRIEAGKLPKRRPSPGGSADDDQTKSSTERLLANLPGPIRHRDVATGSVSVIEKITFFVGAGVPLAGILFLLVGPSLKRRVRRSQAEKPKRRALNDARETLERARDLPPEEAPEAIFDAVRRYLVEALDIPAGDVDPGDLEPRLRDVGCSDDVRESLIEVVSWCEEARFAPAAQIDATEATTKIEESLDTLTSLDRARSSGSLGAVSQTVALLLTATALLAAPTQSAVAETNLDESSRDFRRALKLYDDRKWEESAAKWEETLIDSPEDPVLLHNRALALAHAGRLGPARLAAERAALAAPGNEAIQRSLETIRRLVDLKRLKLSAVRDSIGSMEPGLGNWKTAASVGVRPLAVGIALGLWVLLFGLLGRRFAQRDGYEALGTVITVVALTALAVTAIGWTLQWRVTTTVEPAVLTERPAPRQAPSKHADEAKTSVPLIAGTMVRPVQRREGWVQIRTLQDTHAWLPDSTLESLD